MYGKKKKKRLNACLSSYNSYKFNRDLVKKKKSDWDSNDILTGLSGLWINLRLNNLEFYHSINKNKTFSIVCRFIFSLIIVILTVLALIYITTYLEAAETCSEIYEICKTKIRTLPLFH